MWWRAALASPAIVSPAAVLYFFIFWTWFDFWKRHRTATYVLFSSVFVSFIAATVLLRTVVFSGRLHLLIWAPLVGWALIAVSTVFGTIADRQIGVRVRSFMPFFDEHGRIELRTSGAYGVVRHPIYAAGMWFFVGTFLVTGYPAVLVSTAIFSLGAVWFTKQEERRLMELLDDPAEYDRYRERVPALFPRVTRR